MKHCITIRIHRAQELMSDYHDLMIEEFAAQYDRIRAFGRELGAVVLACEETNDLVGDESYVEVEHNFELTQPQKEQLLCLLKPLFHDGEFEKKRGTWEIQEADTLKAVLFTKTNGELFLMK